MATIKVLSWNIQVWGPQKYGKSLNNTVLAQLVSAVVHKQGANLVMIQEAMTSVAYQIAWTLYACICNETGTDKWAFNVIDCSPDGDRESTIIIYRTDAKFTFVRCCYGSNKFPTGWSNATAGGRRLGMCLFRATDTNQYFVAGTYHSPPGNPVAGVQACAQCPEIWQQPVQGVGTVNIGKRIVSGDFNMDWTNNEDNYEWFTKPSPSQPPPKKGEGCSLVPAVNNAQLIGTHLGSFSDVEEKYMGSSPSKWSSMSYDYRETNNIIDNIFHNCGNAGTGSVLDMLWLFGESGAIRQYANKLRLSDQYGEEAFPHADLIPRNNRFSHMAYAYILYHGAISDHLPVYVSINC